jgi:hypothetical protein
MSRALQGALVAARYLYLQLAPHPESPRLRPFDLTHQAASDLIHDRLLGDDPVMVARLGAVELGCLINHLSIHRRAPILGKSLDYVRGRTAAFWWEEGTLASMAQNGGFFPTDPSLLDRFSAQMLEDMRCVDVLGSWQAGEELFARLLQGAVRVRLRDLEPYYHQNPWTEALAGRTVLVVHPFVESIGRQYSRRSELFEDPRTLPEFELKTVKAVQSIAETETGFRTWFDAYDSMAKEIAATEFDIAILGCGAYGFPLAAHIKRLGKKSVHLGGATQILFGIKGKRWDADGFISRLYNEHWIRPLASERPDEYRLVEDGCYW